MSSTWLGRQGFGSASTPSRPRTGHHPTSDALALIK